MKGPLRIHYDEESDFLEIGIGVATPCYAEEVKPGVFIRKDEETDDVKSIGILGFKKKSKAKDFELKLPVEITLERI